MKLIPFHKTILSIYTSSVIIMSKYVTNFLHLKKGLICQFANLRHSRPQRTAVLAVWVYVGGVKQFSCISALIQMGGFTWTFNTSRWLIRFNHLIPLYCLQTPAGSFSQCCAARHYVISAAWSNSCVGCLKSRRSCREDLGIAFLNLSLLLILHPVFFLSHQPYITWKVARQGEDKAASQQKLSARNKET